MGSTTTAADHSVVTSKPQNPCIGSMEEVWQDIDLSSLLDHSRPCSGSTTAAGGPAAVSLQDFLAQPFHKDSISANLPHPSRQSRRSVSAFPRPPPATSLVKNRLDGPEPDKTRANPTQQRACSSLYNPFMRNNRPDEENGEDHSERKRVRLMKNRESASRSRARKQAYTNELEIEVNHLQEENAKLRRQYHELTLAGPALLPKKHSLRRTLTAPF